MCSLCISLLEFFFLQEICLGDPEGMGNKDTLLEICQKKHDIHFPRFRMRSLAKWNMNNVHMRWALMYAYVPHSIKA